MWKIRDVVRGFCHSAWRSCSVNVRITGGEEGGPPKEQPRSSAQSTGDVSVRGTMDQWCCTALRNLCTAQTRIAAVATLSVHIRPFAGRHRETHPGGGEREDKGVPCFGCDRKGASRKGTSRDAVIGRNPSRCRWACCIGAKSRPVIGRMLCGAAQMQRQYQPQSSWQGSFTGLECYPNMHADSRASKQK